MTQVFVRYRLGGLGLVMVAAVVVVAFLAPWLAPYDPYATITGSSADIMASPSRGHLLGQDDSGKDVLSSVIYGSRISLTVGFAASFIVVVLGATVGMLSGYAGGRVDMVLMRITDAFLVVPRLPLMLVVITVAGRGLANIILVIGLLSWTYMARVVRSQVLTVKERQFILRAKALGVSPARIMTRHILPQVVPVIFAEATLDVSYAILSEATLSFLGLGDPMLISWGSILNRAFLRGAVMREAWWYLIPPGVALAWTTLGLTFLGIALQEMINPRLKTHHLFDEGKTVAIKRLKTRTPILGEAPRF